ncbi:MAG: glycerophosphodiester phosphodiesterase family protein, partial [Bacteroidota bacterium]
MKRNHRVFLLIFCITLFRPLKVKSQQIDSTHFSEKYHHRKSVYESMPNRGGEIVFFGNSITEQGTWSELFGNDRIINRGIGGDTTDGLLFRLDEVIGSRPIKIFMLIGTNDLKYGRSPSYTLERIRAIVTKIKRESPLTKIYLQSVLPTLDRPERPVRKIKSVNEGLKKISKEESVSYLNLFDHFSDSKNSGQLYKHFTRDGLHLNGKGYLKWKELIKEHVWDNANEQLKRNLERIKNPKDPYVFVIAHRGDWRHAPENSIASLKGAITMGVDMVETDLQMTKDGKLIVFHDKTLERTTNGQGQLADYTYDQLSEYHLLDGLGHITEFQIPLLQEYLEIAKNKVILDLDIKSDIPFEKIGQLLRANNMLHQVVV